MKKIIFRGAASALITPFSGGEIDYNALKNIIDMQIEGGINAMVIGGTTGEAATLTDKEMDALYSFCSSYVGGRVKLILGIGSNDTHRVLERCRLYNGLNIDGYLVITPYYNRGTQKGVIEHYRRIADASRHPIILYNVPSRTGVNLSLEDVDLLSDEENIVAIKEAGDSAKRLVALAKMKEKIALYAGCDTQIYTALALGGLGVISVISNLLPKRTADLCKSYFDGNHAFALEEQLALLPFINKMFSETNPAPIKWAMSKSGLCKNELRLPMHPCELE